MHINHYSAYTRISLHQFAVVLLHKVFFCFHYQIRVKYKYRDARAPRCTVRFFPRPKAPPLLSSSSNIPSILSSARLLSPPLAREPSIFPLPRYSHFPPFLSFSHVRTRARLRTFFLFLRTARFFPSEI